MHITLNDRELAVEEGLRLTDLLSRYGIAHDTPGVAVGHNRRIIPKADWATLSLGDGDRLEVIHAVQGG